MSYQGYNGNPPPPGGPRQPDSPWTKTSTIATVVGVVVAVVAAYFAFLAIPHQSPSLSPSPPSTSAAPTVAPSPPASDDGQTAAPQPHVPAAPDPASETATDSDGGQQGGGSGSRSSLSLTVSPVAVNLGDNVTIVGSGFEAAEGLQVRLFRTDSISYPVGPDQIVAAGNGRFTIQGQVDNRGWCGSGTVAVFQGSGSAIGPPPSLDEAVVTSRLGVIC
jgi:hypothetical protein